jgi:hypothetical protein
MAETIPGTKTLELTAVPPPVVTIPPITMTVIGDKNTPSSGTIIEMPGNHPNIIQNVVTPMAAILIRFINAYLTMIVALLGAGMVTNLIPASDFIHLFLKCAALSFAGAALGFLKDLITIFGKLEQKFPLGTGSI